MLVGAGRPGISRGALDDVRDALAGSLWYMRHEGGRYRFTTEPNLNKIIVEREGAIGDERIQQLLREATGAKAPTLAPFRVETNVAETLDIADEPRLTLGVLNAELTADGDGSDAAETILNNRGGSARVNKNAIVIIAADRTGITRARRTARTVAAMQDIMRDQFRLKRFNQEQREQLAERLTDYAARLPQQVVMAYRHLTALGPDGKGGTRVSVVDLGPARVTDSITGRVIAHLTATDRLLSTSLAPAALLTDRFGVIGAENDAVELDKLLGYFYRLPRLPKLAGPDVLRNCLVRGVAEGIFGLASGAAWFATDAVRRFHTSVDPAEIQFQPGTWLVRAAAIKKLIDDHSPTGEPTPSPEPPPEPGGTTPGPPGTSSGSDDVPPPHPDTTTVVVTATRIPASKIRDVVKIAVMPLVSSGATVTVTLEINASRPEGIPQDTLDLVITEGLRQLGIEHHVTQQSPRK